MSDLSKGESQGSVGTIDPAMLVPPPDRKVRVKREAAGEQKARKKHWLVAFLTSRRLLAVLIIAFIVYMFVWIPHFFWEQTPEIPVKMLVADKTVPFQDYREHRGLFWLLVNNKFIDPAKQTDNRFYDYSMDYNGFHPYSDEQIQAAEGEEEAIFTNEFSPFFMGPVAPTKSVEAIHWIYDTIQPMDLADRDILYICDSYGVYSADYWQFRKDYWEGRDIAHTIYSPKIYGGLKNEEIDAIEQFAENRKTIIAEFNTLASPTDELQRDRLESIFGVDWTHWVGRYFVDFSDVTDVPWWLFELYKSKTNRDKWDLEGSGYLFCNEGESDFFILTDKDDMEKGGMLFIPRQDFMEDDVMQGCVTSTFTYWFDVVTVRPDQDIETLADFEFKLTDSGREKMKEHGLPLTIPAVVRRNSYYRSYYMAGEMTEFGKAMGPADTKLSLQINRSFYGREVQGSTGYPFWHTSYPMVTNILRKEADLKVPLKVPVYPFR